MICDVTRETGTKCTNNAAFIATKPCGHKSHICVDCSLDGTTRIIACPQHKAYWPGVAAYTDLDDIPEP